MKRPMISKCPTCASALEVKQVEEVVAGGRDVVRVQVEAEVCNRCGQYLFSPETVRQFEEIRCKLEAGDISSFTQEGHAYRA
jgi:YgiT-type zinc finger domain-containing protein